jgi:hypothetical protein
MWVSETQMIASGSYLLTTAQYTQREQAVLTSLWYCMTGVQLMVRMN